MCDLRRGHDRAGGAVRNAAAIIEAEGIGDHRRAENRLHRHLLLKVRLRAQGAVLMALPRYARHGALEVVLAYAVFGPIAVGELSEAGRRGIDRDRKSTRLNSSH